MTQSNPSLRNSNRSLNEYTKNQNRNVIQSERKAKRSDIPFDPNTGEYITFSPDKDSQNSKP
jgi:hypothetical protein